MKYKREKCINVIYKKYILYIIKRVKTNSVKMNGDHILQKV